MDLLKKYLDQACHNLLCYSQNYGMTAPKDGYEKEWFEAREEIELLNEMIKDTEKEKTTVPLEQQFISRKAFENSMNNLIERLDKSFKEVIDEELSSLDVKNDHTAQQADKMP